MRIAASDLYILYRLYPIARVSYMLWYVTDVLGFMKSCLETPSAIFHDGIFLSYGTAHDSFVLMTARVTKTSDIEPLIEKARRVVYT